MFISNLIHYIDLIMPKEGITGEQIIIGRLILHKTKTLEKVVEVELLFKKDIANTRDEDFIMKQVKNA